MRKIIATLAVLLALLGFVAPKAQAAPSYRVTTQLYAYSTNASAIKTAVDIGLYGSYATFTLYRGQHTSRYDRRNIIYNWVGRGYRVRYYKGSTAITGWYYGSGSGSTARRISVPQQWSAANQVRTINVRVSRS